MRKRCVMRLASGEESGNCRQQIGQRASGLLWTLSRRWIHLSKDADCGSQREDIENVDVVVLPLRPPVSKVQELTRTECNAGREISGGSMVTYVGGKRIFAC